jgi:hypothetical protein
MKNASVRAIDSTDKNPTGSKGGMKSPKKPRITESNPKNAHATNCQIE